MLKFTNILRLQKLLLATTGALAVVYFAVFLPASDRLVRLGQSLTANWDKLVEVNLRNRTRLGLDLETMTESQILAEKSLQASQRSNELLDARLALEPEVRARLQEPFQFFDFDQSRQQMIAELRQLAQVKKVGLEPAALAGYPEYVSGRERPALLWAELAIMNHALTTAVAAGPAAVKTARALPMRTILAGEGKRTLLEFPVRLEWTGSVNTAVVFLRSLLLRAQEMKELDLPVVSAGKPALFLDRWLCTAVPEGNGQVRIDAVVSGFVLDPSPAESGRRPAT
ncbi:MAG TPA: hypothetical protein P5555_01200 [Candidatus Paceibacterota bacterium]|nr:hypothetical protein [Verrucomicrobiota bacterium]HRZ43789.1 hypothetical protein [Candidatus Paceibacterota bacterium]HRZ93486.1 hypothetical protein [Candidatus Paceibacterota bacterium]